MPDASFQDEFLEEVAIAFRKRRRSIAHDASRAELAKVYEKMRAESVARLEIDLMAYGGATVRLWAWPDRYVWLDARRLKKKVGWVWTWTCEGRLAGGKSPADMIAALEKTFSMLGGMEAAKVKALDEPWQKLLARGPKLAR